MSALTKIFLTVGTIIPAAGRQGNRMRAKELFEEFRTSPLGDMKKLESAMIQFHLRAGGYDTETDKPYKEGLKLKDGKREFDSIYPSRNPGVIRDLS